MSRGRNNHGNQCNGEGGATKVNLRRIVGIIKQNGGNPAQNNGSFQSRVAVGTCTDILYVYHHSKHTSAIIIRQQKEKQKQKSNRGGDEDGAKSI